MKKGWLNAARRLTIVSSLSLVLSIIFAWLSVCRVTSSDRLFRHQAPGCQRVTLVSKRIGVEHAISAGGWNKLPSLDPEHVPSWSKVRSCKADRGIFVEQAAGWPALCWMWWGTGPQRIEEAPLVHGGLIIDDCSNPTDWGRTCRILPYLPIWRGLMLNVLIYSSMIGLVYMSVGVSTRWYRCLRGQCQQCGYFNANNSHRCPECGWRRKDATSKETGS